MNARIRLTSYVLFLLALAVGTGCGIGQSRMAFVTNTSHGIDLDTIPPRTSIAFSRQVGVIAPQYPGGEVPPALATLKRADTTNMTWIQKSVATVGKIFGFGVSQNFATGKAAYNLAASTGKIGDQPPMGFREAEAVRIKATNDELRYDRNHGLLELVVVDGLIKGLITGSKLDHKAKNPFFFGTNTNFGLDISYTPQGAPKSVALGLKRQEVAVVVVSPVQTTDVDVKGTAYVVPHVPSLFAGFSLDAGANGTATSMDVQEIFATGTVAEAMAMNGKTREEIMKPALLIPNDVANNLPALNRDQIDFKLWLSDLYWKSDKKRQEDIEKIATDEFNKKGEVSSIQEVFDAEPNELTEELMKAIRSKIGKLPPAPPETQAEEE